MSWPLWFQWLVNEQNNSAFRVVLSSNCTLLKKWNFVVSFQKFLIETLGNQTVSFGIRVLIPVGNYERIQVLVIVCVGKVQDNKTGFSRHTLQVDNFLLVQRILQGRHEDPNGKNPLGSRNFYNASISPREDLSAYRLEKSFRLDFRRSRLDPCLSGQLNQVWVGKISPN